MAEKKSAAADILAGLTPEQREALMAQAASKAKPVQAPKVEIGGNRYTLSVRKAAEGKSRGWILRVKVDLPDPLTGEPRQHQCNIDAYTTKTSAKWAGKDE